MYKYVTDSIDLRGTPLDVHIICTLVSSFVDLLIILHMSRYSAVHLNHNLDNTLCLVVEHKCIALSDECSIMFLKSSLSQVSMSSF